MSLLIDILEQGLISMGKFRENISVFLMLIMPLNIKIEVFSANVCDWSLKLEL